jgi:hypothetical protein
MREQVGKVAWFGAIGFLVPLVSAGTLGAFVTLGTLLGEENAVAGLGQQRMRRCGSRQSTFCKAGLGMFMMHMAAP